ncbi:MAG: T9SS type A sorting domain-containing protein, partial [Bacteroidota bacterium]
QIEDGEVIYLTQTPNPDSLTVEVVAPGVESVKLNLSGYAEKTESIPPYAYAGDNNGNYTPLASFGENSYTLTVEGYDQNGGTGNLLFSKTVNFELAIPNFTFNLIDALGDSVITSIHDGDEINFSSLPNGPANLNIQAIPAASLDTPGSVVMIFTAGGIFPPVRDTATETQAPYAFGGDTGGTPPNYNSITLDAGRHQIKAIAMTHGYGYGNKIDSTAFHFTLTDDGETSRKGRKHLDQLPTDLQTEAIRLYPNPNAGTFTIQSPHPVHRYIVLDILGREVYAQTFDRPRERFKVKLPNRLEPGHYFLRANNESVRLVLQK